MNVARLNMSHGDHTSHKAIVDLVKEYNQFHKGNVAIMLDTKGPEVRSGDLATPIEVQTGKKRNLLLSINFLIQEKGMFSRSKKERTDKTVESQ